MNVLLVDDSPNIIDVLRIALKAKGHRVWTAADGVEALAILEREKIHAMISDILMPRMDGYQLCMEVRKNKRFGDVPFIFYSSTYGSPADEDMGRKLGADKFIKKPAPITELLQALHEATREHARNKLAHDSPPEELGLMKEYSAMLVSKLEKKNLDLEAQTEVLKQREEEVRASQEQLRALAARLQAAREEERIRIAREIHDDLGELLTGIKLGLGWLTEQIQNEPAFANRADVREKIVSLGALAGTTTNRVRKLCTELRPAILDDLGLVAAIEWHMKEFQKQTNIRCEATLSEEQLELGSEQASAIFRIFQEILTNVARHSQASKIRVRLTATEANLLLEVKDNGRGIQASQMKGTGSLGLLGMRERAAGLGGKVDIQGKKGRGTSVSVTIPLATSQSENCSHTEIKQSQLWIRQEVTQIAQE